MWYDKLLKAWNIKEVRNALLFVVVMLVVFRLAAHIPIPGVDLVRLRNFFQANQFLGLLNLFSGGTIQNFSVVALGVAPYITSSIIFQLLTMVVPRLEELSKEGEQGQRRITQWTRLASVPLAFIQSYGLIGLLSRGGAAGAGGIFLDLTPFRMVLMMLTMTAGTIFLMWIGELISEKHVGNGISLLIFSGIIAGLPGALRSLFVTFDRAQVINLIIFAIIGIITVIGVVIMTEGQRNIPVSYARRVIGSSGVGGVSTHLPLRVNMAGVIPIIFAISLILFPTLIAQFFVSAQTDWVASFAQWIIAIFQNQLFYGIFYFLLVFGFTFFYTAVVFHPEQIAENLQKQGGFIPGIRPGKQTEEYLSRVTNRILLFGALFLGAIAILPLIMQQITGNTNLLIGGTSILIVVSVAIEIAKQIEGQISMHEYEKY
ncbi:MAG TPA: preprotein translocase subunit SecY [Candidatus Magasanikbacteria bacterium]|nr:preprotein translocase subunit SecY [Candidatus Magasanikbacteria bacterium]